MITRRLIIEHHVVGTRDTHHKIAACRCEQHQQLIGGVLIRFDMVRVANVETHGQTQQLAHEMVFQTGANDFTIIREIFRTNEAHDRVHKKWIKGARDAIGTRFAGELVDSAVPVNRESGPLSGLEIHHVVANETLTFLMRGQNRFSTFGKAVQRDTESGVRRFGPANALEEKVDGRAAFKRSELRREVREYTRLRWCADPFNQLVKGPFERHDSLDGITSWVDANHRIATPEQQPIKCGERDANDVVCRVIGLNSNTKHALFAHCVSTSRHNSKRSRGRDQISRAHDASDSSNDFGRQCLLHTALP